jgi:serine protease Do
MKKGVITMMNKKDRDVEINRKNHKSVAGIGLCVLLAGSLIFSGVQAFATQTTDIAEVQEAEAQSVLLKKSTDDQRTRGVLDVSDIVEEVMPSIVSISTKSVQEVQDYFSMFGFYGYAPSTQKYEVQGGGSGIIVGKNKDELLIMTNYHVVEDVDEVAVCFIDNNAYKALVKGTDSNKDLAVLAVKLEDLSDDTLDEISIAKIGSSDDLKVGEQIIVVGNAMGYGQSVTTGIVSAKNRQSLKEGGYGSISDDNGDGINLIQTDAAINPGNSGGAMVNMDGEVVGISNQKAGGMLVEGMCYAIAISDVEDSLTEMMNQETRTKIEGEHGAFGIKATSVSEEASQVYGIPSGAFIIEVDEDSAAEKAGLKPNTVITKMNGKTVDGVQQLIEMLEFYAPGEEVEVTVAEQDGNDYEERTYTVTLQKAVSEEDEDDDNLYRDWADAWKDDGFDIPEEDDYWQDQERDDDNDFIFGQGTFGDWD